MKKIISVMMAAALSLTMLAGCGGEEPAPSAAPSAAPNTDAPSAAPAAELNTVQPGKLTMSTNAQFPPYELESDGEGFEGTGYEGIDIEVAAAIAKKLGLELVVDNMGFDACLLAVQNGKSDIAMAGITVNDERLLSMDFTDPYAKGIQAVIVTEDSDITSIDDMTGKKIGAQRATTGYIYCSDTPENGGYGEENVVAYEDGAVAVQALKNGSIDCVVIDKAPAESYVAVNPGLKLLETDFANEDYAIAVGKGNTAMQKAVNDALKELIEDGTVAGIVEKYIPSEG